MKDLIILCVMLSGVLGEAPYPPSGWRPNGPAFELPNNQQYPQGTFRQPVDPRVVPPTASHGVPEDVDISVQGLPTQEQLPLFQVSPINGQQYVGPSFNNDIKILEQNLRVIQTSKEKLKQSNESQFQKQQEIARQLKEQRKLDAAQSLEGNNAHFPREFATRTTSVPEVKITPRPDFKTTEATTKIDLNQGATLDDKNGKEETVSIEITKQKVQEYPPEIFLNPLAQFAVPPQYIQLGQIRAPVYFQPQEFSAKQTSGFDGPAHFAALTSILAQQQIQNQQEAKNPTFVVAEVQPAQAVNTIIPAPQTFSQNQPPFTMQPIAVAENQFGQPDLNTKNVDPSLPQFVYQPYQPQNVYQQQYPIQQEQPQDVQVLLTPQSQYYPVQDLNQYYQNQFISNQNQQFGQDALQSGLDINNQSNDVDDEQEKDGNDEDGDVRDTVTAVATAFGKRTQPRVSTQYGVPVTKTRVETNLETTTEQIEENYQHASDAATSDKRDRIKNGKLRSRRIRPVFTLDRSGHLVLAQ